MSSSDGSDDGDDFSDNDDEDSCMYGGGGGNTSSHGRRRTGGDSSTDQFLGSFIESYNNGDGGGDDDRENKTTKQTVDGEGEDGDDTIDTSNESLMKMLTEEEQNGLFRRPIPEYSSIAIRERMKEMNGHVEIVNPTLYGVKNAKYEVRLKGFEGEILANGYTRVIADEHGCYLQFEHRHLDNRWRTTSKLVMVPAMTKFAEEYGWISLAAKGTPLFYAGDRWDDSTIASKGSQSSSSPIMDQEETEKSATSLQQSALSSAIWKEMQLDSNFVGPTTSPSGKVIPPYRDKTVDGKYTLDHFIYMVQPPSAAQEKAKMSKKNANTKLNKIASASGQTTLSKFLAPCATASATKMIPSSVSSKQSFPTTNVKTAAAEQKSTHQSEPVKRTGYTKHKNFSRGCFYIKVTDVYVVMRITADTVDGSDGNVNVDGDGDA